MKESVNGARQTWTDEIRAKWVKAWRGHEDDMALVTSANYFTPRPFRNEYDRGSRDEGFVYTLEQKVGRILLAR